jgi:hypothetical protein
MPIVRREITKQKWETPENMIKEFIDNYEFLIEGEANQIIYGDLFPSSSPQSIFVFKVTGIPSLDQGGEWQELMTYKIGTIVPFSGSFSGTRGVPNVAYSGDPQRRPWAICDGNRYNGVQTPDLRGRGFIGVQSSDSGADDCSLQEAKGCMKGNISQAGNYAGADNLGLKEIHMPPHVHFYRSPTDITLGGTTVLQYQDNCCYTRRTGGISPRTECVACMRDHAHTNKATTRITTNRISASLSRDGWQPITYLSSGNLTSAVSGPHPNLPPYMVLNWKMFVGY